MTDRITKVYHVTSTDKLECIFNEGLKPTPVVWFWERVEDAMSWVSLHPGEEVILEVDMGKDIFKGHIVARGVRYAKKTIDPTRIRLVVPNPLDKKAGTVTEGINITDDFSVPR